jgi:hypothetical protein
MEVPYVPFEYQSLCAQDSVTGSVLVLRWYSQTCDRGSSSSMMNIPVDIRIGEVNGAKNETKSGSHGASKNTSILPSMRTRDVT